jgi:nicotinamidase-related amidase
MSQLNTALLVIDPVNSCVSEKCESPDLNIHFSKIRQMLPKLNRFIGEFRKINKNIFFANITPWTKDHLADNLNELYTDPRAQYYSDDTTGFDEQFATNKPENTDAIYTKNTYDIFSNTSFICELEKRGIQYLIVTGIFSDGCVLASVISGFSKGYNFIILKDLIETTDVEKRQQLQQLLTDYTFPVMYGRTITSMELLQDLEQVVL